MLFEIGLGIIMSSWILSKIGLGIIMSSWMLLQIDLEHHHVLMDAFANRFGHKSNRFGCFVILKWHNPE